MAPRHDLETLTPMRITFAFFGILALAAAFLLFGAAKSAIHEILAAIMLLIFVISAATVAILGALAKLQSPAQILATTKPTSESTPAPSIFPEPAPKAAGNWVKVGK